MYQLQENGIKRLSDNAFIPDDVGNRDYQEYLRWKAEGNTPEPMPLPSQSINFYANNGTARLERNRQWLIDDAKFYMSELAGHLKRQLAKDGRKALGRNARIQLVSLNRTIETLNEISRIE